MSMAAEKAERAIKNYIRSVVYIDDKIYVDVVDVEKSEKKGQNLSVESGGDAKSTMKAIVDLGEIKPEEAKPRILDHGLSQEAFNIQSSFAKAGVVCGLYQPVEDELEKWGEVAEDHANLKDDAVTHLCERSDLFILDWTFDRKDATKVTIESLLSYLVNNPSSANGDASVRYCVIYSNEKPATVMSKVAPILGVEWDDHLLEKIEGRGWVVLFCGKGADEFPDQLPGRIFAILAKSNQGILRRFALNGIAAIRRDANRILARFANDLDAEFALHCGMTRVEDCAHEDLVMLLSDEVRAVLEDDEKLETEDDAYEGCREFVESLNDEELMNCQSGGELKKDVPLKDFKDICIEQLKLEEVSRYSYRNFKKVFVDCKGGKSLCGLSQKILEWFKASIEKVGGSGYCFGGLSALFSSRVSYGDSKVLRLGTVVKQGDKDFLCVMPSCDCRRLKEDTKFLFWELSPLEQSQPRGFAFTLKTGDGYRMLLIDGKAHDRLQVKIFKPENLLVRFKKNDNNDFIITDTSGSQFTWIGELKHTHAMRAMEYMSGNLRRVGLSEDEWLRLRACR